MKYDWPLFVVVVVAVVVVMFSMFFLISRVFDMMITIPTVTPWRFLDEFQRGVVYMEVSSNGGYP
jgi:ABC-type siderophore export system fused ATPase/permease subunit